MRRRAAANEIISLKDVTVKTVTTAASASLSPDLQRDETIKGHQEVPAGTFDGSDVSHLQLHLDAVDGQDFILEREGKHGSEGRLFPALAASRCRPSLLRLRLAPRRGAECRV